MMAHKKSVAYFLVIIFWWSSWGIVNKMQAQSKLLETHEDVGYREKETTFFRAKDRIIQREAFRVISDPIGNIDAYSFLQKKRYEWVNIGNHGTATRPLWTTAPKDTGTSSGFNVYKAYYKTPLQSRYYHFGSDFPFIQARVDLGQRRRSIVNIVYAKNIAPSWNVGFTLNNTQRNHSLGAIYQEGEQHVRALSYRLFISYLSRDKQYEMIGQLSAISHKVFETGGSQKSNIDPLIPNYYLYRRSPVNLQDAFSLQKQRDWYSLHRFRLTDRYSVYISLQNERETQQYKDTFGEEERTNYYQRTYRSDENTNDTTHFHTHHYTLGLTSKERSLTYRTYVKERIIHYRGNEKTNEKRTAFVEKVAGLAGTYNWQNKQELFGKVELMQHRGRYHYLVRGGSRGFWLNLSYQYTKKNPDIITRYYYGNHHQWERRLLSPQYHEATVKAHLLRGQTMQSTLSAQWLSVQHLIYYNKDALPTQWRPSYLPWRLRTELTWQWDFWRVFHWEAKGVYHYNHKDINKYLPVPALFFYTRLSYRRKFFEEYLHLIAGVEAYGRSAYYGYAYAPAVRQFHLQDEIQMAAYVPVNLFLNVDIESFTAYVKIIHLNQERSSGYLITPYYPGEERFFDMGFVWRFFN